MGEIYDGRIIVSIDSLWGKVSYRLEKVPYDTFLDILIGLREIETKRLCFKGSKNIVILKRDDRGRFQSL